MHAGPRPRSLTPSPVTFRPPRAAGVFTGAVLTAAALGGASVAAVLAGRGEPELKTALGWLAVGGLGAAALLFAAWTFSLATLSYRLEAGNLVIRWGLRRIEVALASVERVLPGRAAEELRVSGLNWWGCHVGRAELRRLGPALVFATAVSPERLLILATSEGAYALSTSQPARFAEEVEAHRVGGPPPSHPQHVTATGIAALPIWRDRTAIGLLLAAVLSCALVVAFVFGQYPATPAIIEVNFPGPSDVVRVGEKDQLLGIAYLAAAVLAGNAVAGVLVHARERAAGLWLLASATGIQVTLLLAAVVAFGGA